MPWQRIGDVELYYEVAGQGAPLLFLHGLGSSSRDWKRQVSHFAEHYRVLICDMRGHGRSSKPPGPYSVELFAADAAELAEALDLVPAHVVGLSMGGMVGLQLAADRPALVRSLTVVNSIPEVRVQSLRRRWQFFVRRLFVRLFGMRAVGWVLARRLFPGAAHAEIREEFARRWAKNDKAAYLASIDAIAGWSVVQRLSAITCPTLFITADQDYTSVAEKRAYAAQMPNADVKVISNARHAVPVERPEAFNEVLEAFLEEEHDVFQGAGF